MEKYGVDMEAMEILEKIDPSLTKEEALEKTASAEEEVINLIKKSSKNKEKLNNKSKKVLDLLESIKNGTAKFYPAPEQNKLTTKVDEVIKE